MRVQEGFSPAEMRHWVDEEKALASREIFYDPDIYRLEQQRIFMKCWLYLAHESELPNPGDFVTRTMGEDAVIVARGPDGQIRAFLNSCSHRGTLVCRADQGHTQAFRCPYHAWVYDTTGKLVAMAHSPEYYGNQIDMAAMGLKQVPRIESTHGLIFGNWDAGAAPLKQYLGDLDWYMQLYFNRTPGGMEVLGAPHRWMMQANWKVGAVNFGSDGPHAVVVHGPITDLTLGKGSRQLLTQMLLECPSISTGPTGAHNGIIIETPPGISPYAGYSPDLVPLYEQHLDAAHQTVMARMFSGVQTTFPNFSWVMAPVSFAPDQPPAMFLAARVWNPRGPERTEIWDWFFVEKEASPEWKQLAMRAGVRTFTAGGTFDADDAEAWAGISRAIRTEGGRDVPINFQAALAFRDQPRTDFPGPGKVYPGAYGEVTEFNVLCEWKRRMVGDGR